MKEIFKISKDKERAKDLFKMAKDRLEIIKILPRDKPYKFIEEYYEIIKELLTAVMYSDGYKTLSHVKLLDYFVENYEIDDSYAKLIDNLRKFRNDIVYYGKKITEDFLVNNENDIKKIIDMLIKFVEKKLK
ncbi:MAG: hypothetical protein KatS3mg001_101 [Candidatus Pacearchaeota archaeon]|nr:MAG: hypothetical protein KatS3mg001_101 [Candidatus Pacearchaeota archaeon]